MGAVDALLRTARRVETPCGAGVMVWHVWGEGVPLGHVSDPPRRRHLRGRGTEALDRARGGA